MAFYCLKKPFTTTHLYIPNKTAEILINTYTYMYVIYGLIKQLFFVCFKVFP